MWYINNNIKSETLNLQKLIKVRPLLQSSKTVIYQEIMNLYHRKRIKLLKNIQQQNSRMMFKQDLTTVRSATITNVFTYHITLIGYPTRSVVSCFWASAITISRFLLPIIRPAEVENINENSLFIISTKITIRKE